MADKKMPYYNRELSWMDFNARCLEEALRKDFSIGGYVGFLFAETAEKYNLILVTSIPQEHFSHTKIRCASTLEEALAIARELCGDALDQMPAALLPFGGSTLPVLKS